MMHTEKASQNIITKDTLVLLMGLFYPAINGYVWRVLVVFTRLIYLDFTQQTFDAIVWTLVIGYIVLTARRTTISARTVIISLFFVLITIFSFLLTDYDYFSVSVLLSLLVVSVSFFLQGSLIDIKRVSHKQLYIAAIITLIVSMLYSIYSINAKDITLEDNMDFAYKVLPSVLVIFSWLFTKQKKTLAIVFSILGTVFLLLQGTRGPLLCLAVFICLMMYKKYGLGKSFFAVGSITLIVTLLLSLQTVRLKLVDLTEKIDSSGYSSRFITMILEDDLSDSNGRDVIKDTLLEDINENPLKIRGMFADRQATRGLVDSESHMMYENGTYAHSLWLEMIYDWGVIFGGVILLLLSFAVLKLVIKSDNDDAYVVMLFICTGFVHLLLSSSYLRSSNFFFLVGLAVNYQMRNKPNVFAVKNSNNNTES